MCFQNDLALAREIGLQSRVIEQQSGVDTCSGSIGSLLSLVSFALSRTFSEECRTD